MGKTHRTKAPLYTQEPPGIQIVALYARVSTLNSQDPEVQFRELREYVARRGWRVAGEYLEYLDRMSGKFERRPDLDRLWRRLQKAQGRRCGGLPLRPIRSKLAPTRECVGGIPHSGYRLH